MTNKKVTQRAQLIREVGALQERVAELEEELHRREKVEQALGEVQKAELRMAQESASLARIGQVISSTLEIEQVYQQFALEVQALVDFDRMSIDITDQETGTFTCKYLFGQDVPGRYVGAVLPVHDSQTGRVLATGQCLIHEDLSRQLELATDGAFLDAGLRSCIMVPLRHKGRIIGNFSLWSQRVGAYRHREQELLERLSDLIAPAIENADLYARARNSEEALREREELFRSLMEHAADAFLIHDLDGNIVDVSQTTCALLGFTREELVGMPAWDIVESMPVGGAREWTGMVPGVSLTDWSTWQRKDGSTFPVEVHLSTFELRGQRLIFALGRDITERQEAENPLRESEQRFRVLMEHSADAFFIHDLQGRIVDVNQMACESLGYSRDELLQSSVTDIYPLSLRDGASEWRSMVPGVPVTLMSYHQRKDGTTFPTEVNISTFDLQENRLVLAVARDVTERQAMETGRRELAVLEERNRLARELHDSVTQALYSVSLMSEAGRRFAEAGDLDRVRRYLGRLGDSCQQALKEMRLLVFQLRPSVLEKEGLVGALRQRLDAVEKRAGVEARVVFDEIPDLPPRWEEELYRISQEALNNALKHSGATSVTVRITTQPGNVSLEVEDNGKGFDLGAVTGNGGLGLTSMRERAETISGTLNVISEPGKRTKILVQSAIPAPGQGPYPINGVSK